MSFASSLHSPPTRKTGNKEPIGSSSRIRSSPPHDEGPQPTSPQDDEEAGWSTVRSAGRGNSSRGFERRGMRGERSERGDRVERGERADRGERGERRGGRESYDGAPPKSTSFRSVREGESHNWRSERSQQEATANSRNGKYDERAEFLEDEETFGGGGGQGHSAEDFQEWISKMRGGNPKSEEEVQEAKDDTALENGSSIGNLPVLVR